VDFETKTEQVRRQIKKGEVVVCFDEQSETCTLMTKPEFDGFAK